MMDSPQQPVGVVSTTTTATTTTPRSSHGNQQRTTPQQQKRQQQQTKAAWQACLICRKSEEIDGEIVLLPCFHVLCKGACSERVFGSARHRCPLCHTPFNISAFKNKGEERTFKLSELHVPAVTVKQEAVELILCNHCIRKAVAVSFCGDCKDVSEGDKDGVRFLCEKCEEYHSFSVATSTHPTHPIGEYLRKEEEPSFKKGDVVVCVNDHGDAKKGPFMFCKKCDGVVCSGCHGNNGPCRVNHPSDVVTLSEGIQVVMEKVGVWRRGVGKTLSLIRTESAQIQRRIAELNTTERKAVLKEVDEAFVRLLHAQVARHLAVKAEVGVAFDSAAAFLKAKEEERVAGMKSGLQFGMFLKGVLDTPKDQVGVILRGYRLMGERKREVIGSGGGQEEEDWWGGLFRGGSGSPVDCQKVGVALSVANEGVLMGEIKKFVSVQQLGTTATQQQQPTTTIPAPKRQSAVPDIKQPTTTTTPTQKPVPIPRQPVTIVRYNKQQLQQQPLKLTPIIQQQQQPRFATKQQQPVVMKTYSRADNKSSSSQKSVPSATSVHHNNKNNSNHGDDPLALPQQQNGLEEEELTIERVEVVEDEPKEDGKKNKKCTKVAESEEEESTEEIDLDSNEGILKIRSLVTTTTGCHVSPAKSLSPSKMSPVIHLHKIDVVNNLSGATPTSAGNQSEGATPTNTATESGRRRPRKEALALRIEAASDGMGGEEESSTPTFIQTTTTTATPTTSGSGKKRTRRMRSRSSEGGDKDAVGVVMRQRQRSPGKREIKPSKRNLHTLSFDDYEEEEDENDDVSERKRKRLSSETSSKTPNEKKKRGPKPGPKKSVTAKKRGRKPKNFQAEKEDDAISTTSTVHEEYCAICRDGGDSIICCDGCSKVFHVECHLPPLKAIPEGDFFCNFCKRGEDALQGDNLGDFSRIIPPGDEPSIHKDEKEYLKVCKFMSEVFKLENSLEVRDLVAGVFCGPTAASSAAAAAAAAASVGGVNKKGGKGKKKDNNGENEEEEEVVVKGFVGELSNKFMGLPHPSPLFQIARQVATNTPVPFPTFSSVVKALEERVLKAWKMALEEKLGVATNNKLPLPLKVLQQFSEGVARLAETTIGDEGVAKEEKV